MNLCRKIGVLVLLSRDNPYTIDLGRSMQNPGFPVILKGYDVYQHVMLTGYGQELCSLCLDFLIGFNLDVLPVTIHKVTRQYTRRRYNQNLHPG